MFGKLGKAIDPNAIMNAASLWLAATQKMGVKVPEIVKEAAKDKMPMLLGLKPDDEAKMGQILAAAKLVNSPNGEALANFLNNKMDFHQRNWFRYVMVKMPDVNDSSDKSGPKEVPGKMESSAVKFLQQFVMLINKDENSAKDYIRAFGILKEKSGLYQLTVNKVNEGWQWFQNTILVFFGVSSLSDITADIVAAKAKELGVKVDGHIEGTFKCIDRETENLSLVKNLRDSADRRKRMAESSWDKKNWLKKLFWVTWH